MNSQTNTKKLKLKRANELRNISELTDKELKEINAVKVEANFSDFDSYLYNNINIDDKCFQQQKIKID